MERTVFFSLRIGSAHWEPGIPLHIDKVELELHGFPYESVPGSGLLNQWACIVEQETTPHGAVALNHCWLLQLIQSLVLMVMMELLVCPMCIFPSSQVCYMWPEFAGPYHPSCDEERWWLLLLECLPSWCYALIAPCWCNWRCFGWRAGSHWLGVLSRWSDLQLSCAESPRNVLWSMSSSAWRPLCRRCFGPVNQVTQHRQAVRWLLERQAI